MSEQERVEKIESPQGEQPAEITQEQAAKVLVEAQRQRVSECEKEIGKVLDRFQCGILPVVTLVGGAAPQAEVRVVPRG